MDENNELQELINKYKVVSKGSPFTHTSIGNPKVSLGFKGNEVSLCKVLLSSDNK